MSKICHEISFQKKFGHAKQTVLILATVPAALSGGDFFPSTYVFSGTAPGKNGRYAAVPMVVFKYAMIV
jgi:hypothetical protein